MVSPVAKQIMDRMEELENEYQHEMRELEGRLGAFQLGCEHAIRDPKESWDCDHCGYFLQDRMGRERAIQRGRV